MQFQFAMSTARVLPLVKLVLNFSQKDKLQTVNLCDFSNKLLTEKRREEFMGITWRIPKNDLSSRGRSGL